MINININQSESKTIIEIIGHASDYTCGCVSTISQFLMYELFFQSKMNYGQELKGYGKYEIEELTEKGQYLLDVFLRSIRKLSEMYPNEIEFKEDTINDL